MRPVQTTAVSSIAAKSAQLSEEHALLSESVGATATTAGPLESVGAVADGVGLIEQERATPRGAGQTRPTTRAMFSALRHRNFRLFFFGQMISLVGTWMQMIARAWLVFELTQSGSWLGIATAAASVPVLFLSLPAGVIVDRISKHKIIIITQVMSMVLAFALAAVTWLGVVEVWHIIAISLLLGVANAFDAPARQAFVVEMVGKEDLLNAIALNSTIFNLARVLGPALAGALLALTDAATCFFLNGISFIAVIGGLLMMRLPPFVEKPRTGSAWANLVEGLYYIRGNVTVRSLLILSGITSLFGMNYATLMPLMAEKVLKVGESGYGVLMAAAGVGALAGALLLAATSSSGTRIRGKMIMVGAGLFALFLTLFALSPSYPLSLVLLALTGLALISQNATTNTVIQTSVPDNLRGRVMSVYSLLFLGIAPAGGLLAGVLADIFSAPISLTIGAVICGVTVIVLWIRRPALVEIA